MKIIYLRVLLCDNATSKNYIQYLFIEIMKYYRHKFVVCLELEFCILTLNVISSNSKSCTEDFNWKFKSVRGKENWFIFFIIYQELTHKIIFCDILINVMWWECDVMWECYVMRMISRETLEDLILIL